jgi:hypothetical protein
MSAVESHSTLVSEAPGVATPIPVDGVCQSVQLRRGTTVASACLKVATGVEFRSRGGLLNTEVA